MQPSSGVTDTRHQLTLDERVHVFVLGGRFGVEERGITGAAQDLFERGADRERVRTRQHPGALEPFRPRQTAGHIVLEQPAVEGKGRTELEQPPVGIPFEPTRPEMSHYAVTLGATVD